jgi:hypothetical protein
MRDVTLAEEDEVSRGISREGEAVLFNAGVRALASFGYSDISFDIGGKKSRRRYANVISPTGNAWSIWIKATPRWVGMADVLRFPWSKNAVRDDNLQGILFAADDGVRRGSSHLLAVIGDDFTGILEVARLYTLEQIKQIKQIAIEQKSACKHPRATADRLTVG